MESNKQQNKNWIEVVMLASWAAFFIFILMSGRLPLYIHPRFTALPVIGAAILVAMILSLGFGKRSISCGGQRDWSHLSWFVMPICLGLMVAPSGLGAFVASSRQGNLLSGNPGNSAITLDLGAGSQCKNVTIAELTGAGTISAGNVSVDGQILPSVPGLDSNECLLAHYTMVCCAADLRTVAVILKYTGGYHPENNSWVRVRGTVKREKRGVIINAQVIMPIKQPNPPYLY